MNTLTVRPVRFPEEAPALRTLIGEYIAWLGIDLAYQGVDDELANLPRVYAGANGFMLVATDGDKLVGCVGMKWKGEGVGEMKRLYLRPAYQGRGTGIGLIRSAIAHAALHGARRIVLDTAPGTETAQKLYLRAGFRECAPYYDSPLPGARYFYYEIDNVDRHFR